MEEKNKKEMGPLSCRGLRSEHSVVDQDLWAWYCQARSGGARRVSKSLLQRHARLAFSKAGIYNFKASDGWYRRWINRWQKRCPAAMNVLLRATTPSSQPQVVDCRDIVSDVASKSLSTKICRFKDGELEILQTEGTNSIENITLQSQFSGLEQENASKSLVAVPVKDDQPTRPDTSLVTNKPAYLNCLKNELAKQNISGSNDFVTSDKNVADFGSNSTRREMCPSDLQLKSNKTRKLQKCVSEKHDEDEHFKNVNDNSLDIMDYLTLHITESCENSQFGNSSHCMSHSDTIDHILGSTTSDSFLCCSLLGDQQVQPTIDIGTYSDHLGIDHLREFASLVSQFAGSPTYIHKAPRSVPPSSDKPVVQVDSISLSKNTPNLEKSQLATKSITIPVTTSDINLASQIETSQTKLSTREAVKLDVVSRDPVVPSFAQQDRKKKKKKKVLNKHLKKGERYLPKLKKKVLAYALTHTLKDTARKFKVKSSTISAWKMDKTMMNSEQVPSRQRLTGREVARPADWQFLAWLRWCREVDHEVTRQEVLQRAEQLVAQCSSKPEPHECSRWFLMWFERMKKQLAEDELELWVITDRAKEQHIKYPLAFKMEISKFADHYSQTKASKVFNISRKRVFEWLNVFRKKQNVSESEADPEVNQQYVGGKTAADVEVDLQIWEWYSKQVKKPSGQEVRQKGVELYQARGHTQMKCSHNWYRRWSKRHQVGGRHSGDELLLEWVLTQLEQGHAVSLASLQARALSLLADTTTTPFKASPGWAIRFCKRYPELLYHYPTVESVLPQSLMTKVDEFRLCMRRVIQEKCVKLSAVGCMDEFHVNLSDLIPVNAESGSRRQLLRRPSLGNCHVTVVLACLADGSLLPPMVIAMGNLDPVPDEQDLLVVYQENAHMDEKCMKFWLKHIWFERMVSPSVLVMDCYEAHTLPSINEMCAARDTSCLVIPGGCASKLQPLDIAVKKSFQEALERQWAALNMQVPRSWGGSTSLQLPGHHKVVEWVSAAYKHILHTMKETIRRSFLVTGLTVAENHNEDHFIENLSTVPTRSKQFSVSVQHDYVTLM